MLDRGPVVCASTICIHYDLVNSIPSSCDLALEQQCRQSGSFIKKNPPKKQGMPCCDPLWLLAIPEMVNPCIWCFPMVEWTAAKANEFTVLVLATTEFSSCSSALQRLDSHCCCVHCSAGGLHCCKSLVRPLLQSMQCLAVQVL